MALTLHICSLVLAVLLLLSRRADTSGSCIDDQSCQAHVRSVIDELDSLGAEMQGTRRTIDSLDRLTRNVATGVRTELSPLQREHLEKAGVFVDAVSFDTKHRPISTNRTRHVHKSKLLANASEVCLHGFMPIKPKSLTSKSGPFTLLISISVDGRLSVHSVASGDLLVDAMDLGHPAGVRIRHLVLSQGGSSHHIFTADDLGEMRVHTVKIVAKTWTDVAPRALKATTLEDSMGVDDNVTGVRPLDSQEAPQSMLAEPATRIADKKITVSTNLSHSLKLPLDANGNKLSLTSMISVERDDGVHFIAGDSRGGITVFHQDGRLGGRTKVTDDSAGVIGFVRGQGKQLAFFSPRSFGFFSVSQLDMPFAPCTGWSTPLVDLVFDTTTAKTKAILSLADGDVLVFLAKEDKGRACELLYKFPRVSRLPFKLQMWKYHAVGMQLPPVNSPRLHGDTKGHLRELFFFNLLDMSHVHGNVASRIVTAQLNFSPRHLDAFAINGISGMAPGERSRAQLALRFAGEHGVEVSELTLKQPTASNASNDSDQGIVSLLWRFPKVAIFAVAVLGVVIWNVVFKASSQKSEANGNNDSSMDEGAKDSKGPSA